jgi:hypothetical protein
VEIEKYQPMVEELSRVVPKRKRKDAKQDLWLITLQFLKDYGESDAMESFVKKEFDLKRNRDRRRDQGEVCAKRSDFGYRKSIRVIDSIGLDSIEEKFLADNSSAPDKYISEEELQRILKKWVSKKGNSTKRFIQECICPSSEVLKMWDELMKTYPRYKSFQEIPPKTLALRILGMKGSEYQKIILKLSTFLEKKGYGKRKGVFGYYKNNGGSYAI